MANGKIQQKKDFNKTKAGALWLVLKIQQKIKTINKNQLIKFQAQC